MKTYYLTLSRYFPKDLPNGGKPTNFENAFLSGQGEKRSCKYYKIHTIRENYDFWKKRFEKIEAGEACLSIRQWVGKPYAKGSTQREIALLTRENGIGIQELKVSGKTIFRSNVFIDGKFHFKWVIAHNDGLEYEDWCNWFAGYDLSKPMAVIQLTNFRYL